MRRIAIMSKRRFAQLPYVDWLGAPDRELLLFANEQDEVARLAARSPASGLSSACLLPQWNDDEALANALLAEHRRTPIDALVALSETDLIRAARFREMLGVPGQTLRSALAFRDKRVMKELARSAGLLVPAFASVTSAQDLVDFAAQTPGPIVLKPAAGGGCVGVRVIDDIEALLTTAPELFEAGPAEYIAEEYIDAPVLTVDGVMADGSVVDSCVSTYPLDCYTCLRDCAPIGLLQLDDDDPVASRARAYLEALVAALPCASLTTCFHCELFDSASRGMMLCEIASRTGGGRIQDMFRHSRGVDLTQWAALGQAGVDPVGVIAPPARSRMLTAFALFPSPGGVLIDAPKAPAPSSVIDYRVYTRCGDYMPRWKRVSEYAVDALIGADTRGALELAYRDTLEWVESGLVWARAAV